jgi:ABC-2 type transport system permease protein
MNALAGTGGLIRLILRRDRVLLSVWMVVLVAYVMSAAQGTVSLYGDPAVARAFAEAVASNVGEVASRGPVYAPTIGGLTAWAVGMGSAILNGLVTQLEVIRHTRADEQSGRRELSGSAAVGRGAQVAAVLIVVLGVNVVVGVLMTAGLTGLVGMPLGGSAVLGLANAGCAMVMAGAAAVAAQLTQGAGAARGIAALFLAAAYLTRGAGDATGTPWLTWASPMGWVRLTRAYAGERWWIAGLFAGLALVLTAVSLALAARRDLGAGLIPTRAGRASGSRWLSSAAALAWRRSRGGLLGWTLTFVGLGLAIGAVAGSVGDQLSGTPLRVILQGADVELAMYRLLAYVLAQVVAAYAIIAMLRIRADETAGLADPVVSTATSRLRWAGGLAGVGVLGTMIVLLGFGLGAGLGFGSPRFGTALGDALAYIPACLLLGGVALALVGLAPRIATPASWTVLGLAVLLDLLGEFQIIGPEVIRLSPFQLSGHPSVLNLASLTAIALVLGAVGLVGLRRRDLG